MRSTREGQVKAGLSLGDNKIRTYEGPSGEYHIFSTWSLLFCLQNLPGGSAQEKGARILLPALRPVVLLLRLRYASCVLLFTPAPARPTRLMPIRRRIAGSGTLPGTLPPEVVPKEKRTSAMVEAAVTPGTESVQVLVWLTKGLWGSFPAIELFALV